MVTDIASKTRDRYLIPRVVKVANDLPLVPAPHKKMHRRTKMVTSIKWFQEQFCEFSFDSKPFGGC